MLISNLTNNSISRTRQSFTVTIHLVKDLVRIQTTLLTFAGTKTIVSLLVES